MDLTYDNRQRPDQARPRPRREAARAVLAISDRKHDAWDALRAALGGIVTPAEVRKLSGSDRDRAILDLGNALIRLWEAAETFVLCMGDDEAPYPCDKCGRQLEAALRELREMKL